MFSCFSDQYYCWNNIDQVKNVLSAEVKTSNWYPSHQALKTKWVRLYFEISNLFDCFTFFKKETALFVRHVFIYFSLSNLSPLFYFYSAPFCQLHFSLILFLEKLKPGLFRFRHLDKSRKPAEKVKSNLQGQNWDTFVQYLFVCWSHSKINSQKMTSRSKFWKTETHGYFFFLTKDSEKLGDIKIISHENLWRISQNIHIFQNFCLKQLFLFARYIFSENECASIFSA